ncbi:hypothetical protein PAHAL_3G274700 [Panicum hallii]|nr:hypothetical protein PAHAL_3G274700 [Panicum hallii]
MLSDKRSVLRTPLITVMECNNLDRVLISHCAISTNKYL